LLEDRDRYTLAYERMAPDCRETMTVYVYSLVADLIDIPAIDRARFVVAIFSQLDEFRAYGIVCRSTTTTGYRRALDLYAAGVSDYPDEDEPDPDDYDDPVDAIVHADAAAGRTSIVALFGSSYAEIGEYVSTLTTAPGAFASFAKDFRMPLWDLCRSISLRVASAGVAMIVPAGSYRDDTRRLIGAFLQLQPFGALLSEAVGTLDYQRACRYLDVPVDYRPALQQLPPFNDLDPAGVLFFVYNLVSPQDVEFLAEYAATRSKTLTLCVLKPPAKDTYVPECLYRGARADTLWRRLYRDNPLIVVLSCLPRTTRRGDHVRYTSRTRYCRLCR